MLEVSLAALRFTLKAQSDRNAPLLSDYHLESLIYSGKLDLVEMQRKICWSEAGKNHNGKQRCATAANSQRSSEAGGGDTLMTHASLKRQAYFRHSPCCYHLIRHSVRTTAGQQTRLFNLALCWSSGHICNPHAIPLSAASGEPFMLLVTGL